MFYLGGGRNSELVGTLENGHFLTLTFIFCVLNLSLASIKAHPKILVPFHRAGIEIFSLVLSIPTPQILSFGAASTM